MIGLIHTLLFELIEKNAGAEAAAQVRQRAGIPLDKEFRIHEVYPEDEWQRLYRASCEVLKITPEQADTAYADYFQKDVRRRFPAWFKMFRNARDLFDHQPVIHNIFAAGLQDPSSRAAVRDKFRVEWCDGEMVMHYRSPNRHCNLYVAIARWNLDYYKEKAEVQEVRCMKRGDPECEIHIRWEGT